ncbi:MAG: BON domain-containing protein [Vicinamibacterales bacterium]
MVRRPALILAMVAAVIAAAPARAQAPPRPLTDALEAIWRLDQYTVFDWVGGSYDRGTLTLQGFAARPELKQRAVRTAKATAGVDEVVDAIELLPTHQSDDSLRIRAYVAIYSHPALQIYSPGGGGFDSGVAIRELETVGRFGIDASSQFRGPHPIHIIVSGGRIQLFGTVHGSQDRQIAEVQVRNLSGVLGVINHIQVRRGGD